MERVSRFRRNDACFIQSLDVDMESNTGMKKAALLESEEEEERKGGREKSFELGSPKQPRERKKKKKRGSRVCVTLRPGCDLFSVK